MSFVGQPEKYSEILIRVFWGHFVVACVSARAIADYSTGFRSLLDMLSVKVSIAGLDNLPGGIVAVGLVVAGLARMIKLHDRLANLFQIRQTFDLNEILKPLIAGVGQQADDLVAKCLSDNRQPLMRRVFYTYASFESPVIDSQLVRSQADRWAWFWTAFEPIPVLLVACVVTMLLGGVMWPLSLVGLLILQGLVCVGLLPGLKRGAADQVKAILEDPERAKHVRAAFDPCRQSTGSGQ